jgi:hypothetical protein
VIVMKLSGEVSEYANACTKTILYAKNINIDHFNAIDVEIALDHVQGEAVINLHPFKDDEKYKDAYIELLQDLQVRACNEIFTRVANAYIEKAHKSFDKKFKSLRRRHPGWSESLDIGEIQW